MQPKPEAAPIAATTLTESAPSLLDQVVQQQQREVAARYQPVMSIEEMVRREEALTYLVEKVMREGIDYGWVPGTKPTSQAAQGDYQAKPTLFKAGAERACAFFGYAPQFQRTQTIEEWTTEKYGEMLFFFEYCCTLSKDGKAVGQGYGSGSTFESKYRYRNAGRTCPHCGAAAIIKGKTEYGGGWLCYGKKGGCGAKFTDGDLLIEGQEVGKVANPDIADVINTVSKIAQKRSYVAATLTATGLSGRFTQDAEDLPADAFDKDRGKAAPAPGPRQQTEEFAEPTPPPKGQQKKTAPPAAPAPAAEPDTPIRAFEREFRGRDRIGRLKMFQELKGSLRYQLGAEAGEARYREILRANGAEKSDKFGSLGDAIRCILQLKQADMDLADNPVVDEPAAPDAAAEPEPVAAGFIASDEDIPF